jgi:glycerol-3-phosphate dehydrogenase
MNIRQTNWDIAKKTSFDIAIIGGGISGASIYKELCQQGYRVFLLDKGDFSCGTSQASAMMVWGGLLYLKNLDFVSVYNFSKDRDTLITSFSNQIVSKSFRFIPNSEWGRNKYFVYLALQLYWMLGKFNRERPTFQKKYEELDVINQKHGTDSIIYQEGFLKQSDCRFVLDWILNHQTEDCLAINYCSIQDANFNNKDKLWALDIKDYFSKDQCTLRARVLLNCAGVWVDKVNEQFGIRSPYKHVYSKGVFLGYERPDKHYLPLIFDMGENGDNLAFIPWGPVSLWGPTETMESSIEEGYSIAPGDIHFLLRYASKHLDPSLTKSRIISLRCGLRPLAVKKDFDADCYPLDISRRHKIVDNPDVPWISIYGGKISGCISMAEKVAKIITNKIPPSLKKIICPHNKAGEISWSSFPGLHDKVPEIDWCVSNEFCCTLEDYLRRRTNISQWIPREGLGFQDENLEYLKNLSSRLPEYEGKNHDSHLRQYMSKVRGRFDKPIEQIQ